MLLTKGNKVVPLRPSGSRTTLPDSQTPGSSSVPVYLYWQLVVSTIPRLSHHCRTRHVPPHCSNGSPLIHLGGGGTQEGVGGTKRGFFPILKRQIKRRSSVEVV